MKIELQKFHNDCLSIHQSLMFDTLLHKSNIHTKNAKLFTFENEENIELTPLRGYLAYKEINETIHTYFIEEKFYNMMPIRILTTEEVYYKESSTKKLIVLRPLSVKGFKIMPEQTFESTRQLIDELSQFEHTNPDGQRMAIIIALMGVISKIFCGISSPSEFGKSGLFNMIHGITQKSIVYQPRTEAGVLIHINEDGNMIFDEACDCEPKVKKIIGGFTLKIADNSPKYHNGAIKAKFLKQNYDIINQSLCFIYNTYDYYDDPKNFFDNMFGNNPAIHSRILKLKFDGKLTEKFTKDFDIMQTAKDNQLYYMKLAKHILWLKEVRGRNKYVRKFNYQSPYKIKGRKSLIYDEITWLIDIYCDHVQEYEHSIEVLDNAIRDYREMMKEGKQRILVEEEVK